MGIRDILGHAPPAKECPACKRPVVWIRTPGGKVAVDATAACYRVEVVDRGTGEVKGDRDVTTAVNHFATCPEREKLRRIIARHQQQRAA